LIFLGEYFVIFGGVGKGKEPEGAGSEKDDEHIDSHILFVSAHEQFVVKRVFAVLQ
jgi:hypothetical protein